ncbi:MAG: hypothetical protein ACRD2X_01385 [Vicinamibacteraceae bacterium]
MADDPFDTGKTSTAGTIGMLVLALAFMAWLSGFLWVFFPWAAQPIATWLAESAAEHEWATIAALVDATYEYRLPLLTVGGLICGIAAFISYHSFKNS